jgi:hypothetical protein
MGKKCVDDFLDGLLIIFFVEVIEHVMIFSTALYVVFSFYFLDMPLLYCS